MIQLIALARGLPLKAIGYGAVVIGIFFTGATVNGWRWEAKWEKREAAYSDAVTEATRQALEREHVLQDALAIVDAEGVINERKHRDETDRLRGDVERGTIRLRVAARCPSSVPQASAGPGLDLGTRAELDPSARPDYFALVGGIKQSENTLDACQKALKAVYK
jgi:prophage endopeptidase